MKKILVLGALLLFFLSGCATKVIVTGGPQISVPQGGSGGSGRLRQFFPPNNMIVVANSTTAPMVVTVYQVSGPREVRLEAGQQTEFTFRQLYRSEVVVLIKIYDPDTGDLLDTADRQFYLTDDGGHLRIYTWVVRTTNNQRRIIR